jgi:signal transduction histidine kinase
VTVHHPVNILIVDDKAENLLALQALFQDSGYHIFEAISGKEAFDLAKLNDFACILLDVQMPILDGFETAKALRRLPRSESTPIIFVTALHRSDEYEVKGYISGAVDYLFKPINPEILMAKVAVFVDLYRKTEEIKAQKKLLEEAVEKFRENDELKAALLARDEFLSMASHELKTPITPLNLQMQTFIELFESGKHKDIDPSKLIRMLRTSQAQVDRLTRLIYDLVDVTKLTSKKLELQLAEADLRELVSKVIVDFETEIRKAKIEINLHLAPDVKGSWDAFRIEQIIINLLTNALKYGNAKPVNIYVKKENDKAILEIHDNGIGIAPENQARIFDRYERAVSGLNYGGLGLGLYISRQIAALHHGVIVVKSTQGEGSIFRMELPAL